MTRERTILNYRQFIFSEESIDARYKDYIKYLLSIHKEGLTCQEVSSIGGLKRSSLTALFKTMRENGEIQLGGFRKSSTSNRLVQYFLIPKA